MFEMIVERKHSSLNSPVTKQLFKYVTHDSNFGRDKIFQVYLLVADRGSKEDMKLKKR